MRGKAAFIGFLAIQAIVVVIYVTALMPLAGPSGVPFIAQDVQIWSGAVFSDLSTNFRSRSTAVTAATFNAFGGLLWSALLMTASAVAAYVASFTFRGGRVWLAAGLAGAALALGAGAAFFIVEQWSGDTSFPPASVNSVWLYMITRSFLIQLVIGFALIAAATVLAIAGFATAKNPLGFGWIAFNWIIAAAVWVAVYVGLYVLPLLNTPAT